jgi:type III pantothenate kinase
MLVLLDQGNSSLKAALWEESVRRTSRMPHEGGSPPWEDWAREHPDARLLGVSVTPSRRGALETALGRWWGAGVEWVDVGWRFPFSLEPLVSPGTTGADRLAQAAGAVRLEPGAGGWIVVAVGTAITVDLVDLERGFLGGAILPGPELFLSSLGGAADQLPAGLPVPPFPRRSWGADTRSAMGVGATWGSLGAVRLLVGRAVDRLGGSAAVVVTGGGGAEWASRLEPPARYEPHLVFHGLAGLAERNPPRGPDPSVPKSTPDGQ